MNALTQRLHQFWYQPAPAERIAILRIATGGFALWYLLSRYEMLQKLSRSDITMFEPVGLAKILYEPIAPGVFTLLLLVTILFNVAYIAGWKFKWTGPVFALLLLFLLSYRNSWTMIYHNRIALVLHVFIIGVVASADAFSVDAWEKAKAGAKKATAHWRYGWPIRLICAGTVLTYFLSGIAKVLGELAWDWVSGEAMRSQVAIDALRKELLGGKAEPLFEWLYPHAELFLFFAIGTMIIELGAPFALAGRRVGMVWAVLTWLMHWGIFFIMGIRFRHHMSGILFLPFFEVEKLGSWLQRVKSRVSKAEKVTTKQNMKPAVVLFDGVCNFCDASVRFVLDRDSKEYFQFASLQSSVGRRLLQQYQAQQDLSTIILIENGRMYLRSTAVLRIARRLDGAWPLLYGLMVVPASVRDTVYRWIAQHRYQWFGQKTVCELPQPGIQQRFLN